MNILIDLNHPADVHFFRFAIQKLEQQGHKVIITSRDKDVTVSLLDRFQIKHQCLSTASSGLWNMAIELMIREFKVLLICLKEKIQVCAAFTGACTAQIGTLLRIPRLVFYDTEGATLQNKISYPFASKILTPESYKGDLGKKHVRFAGVKELAYLHPNYFKPNPAILEDLAVTAEQKFVLVRTVAWKAAHDKSEKGIDIQTRREIIEKLSPHAKVFFIAEDQLGDEFRSYRLPTSPDKIHHVLHYASLYIGEGATMASEAACLGTPSIYVNSQKPGYIAYEEQAGLIFHLDDREQIIAKALDILNTTDKAYWHQKQESFLKNTIDVSQWIADQITGAVAQ